MGADCARLVVQLSVSDLKKRLARHAFTLGICKISPYYFISAPNAFFRPPLAADSCLSFDSVSGR